MKRGIRTKIMFYTGLVVTFSLVVSGTFAYVRFARILKEQANEDDTIKLNQTAMQIKYIQEDIIKFSHVIITDRKIQEFIFNSNSQDVTSKVINKYNMERHLQWLISLRDYIHSACVVNNNGVIFSTADPFIDFENEFNRDWYVNYKKGTGGSIFSGVHDLKIRDITTSVISYFIPISCIDEPGRTIGELILNINFSHIKNILDVTGRDFKKYILYNSNTGILFSRDLENATGNPLDYLNVFDGNGQTASTQIMETQAGYYYMDSSMKSNWTLLAYNPKSEIFKRIRYLVYYFVLFILISIILIVLVMTPVSSRITKPLVNLANVLKQVSMGNLDVSISIHTNDEIQVLSNCFNRMVVDLKNHIRESLEHEKAEKRMQFELLLSQINPHFIYNTLNSVIYLARKDRSEDIIKMTSSFISILQDIIGIGEEGVFASVEQEIKVVEYYMEVQKPRFRNRISIVWDVDSSLLDCIIPKTIIQPLVENSLFHGINPKHEYGVISISIHQEGQKLHIKVHDNGVGLDNETIDRIMKHRHNTETKNRLRSIGLSNIRARIKHLYGSEYDISIEGSKGQGTTVLVKLPLQKNNSK